MYNTNLKHHSKQKLNRKSQTSNYNRLEFSPVEIPIKLRLKIPQAASFSLFFSLSLNYFKNDLLSSSLAPKCPEGKAMNQ